jgi:hypothetical protein
MTLLESYNDLRTDPQRAMLGVSPDLEAAQTTLLASKNNDERAVSLSAWLMKHQPCLFGRMAARSGLIAYCFITDDDIHQGDSHVSGIIQSAHQRWISDTFRGQRSAFILLVVSQRLATACPDAAAFCFAQRLASLLLLDEVEADRIYLDQAFLAVGAEHVLQWHAGVNFFSAAADRRWWHDHRIPGGMGFSVNSVGHMAMSAKLGHAVYSLGIEDHELADRKVNNLEDAHRFAMLTIDNATVLDYGPATWLLNDNEAKCPPHLHALGKKLEGKAPCEYAGLYHTDVTLPSIYFNPSVAPPTGTTPHVLDFTYLYVDSLENPAHTTMALGKHIRGVQEHAHGPSPSKASRFVPTRRSIGDLPADIRRLLRF